MITLKRVLAAAQDHQDEMAKRRRQRPDNTGHQDEKRWALLVTEDEIAELVEEIVTNKEFQNLEGVPGLDAITAQHIIHRRALLHLHGIPIMPELMIVPGSDPTHG